MIKVNGLDFTLNPGARHLFGYLGEAVQEARRNESLGDLNCLSSLKYWMER
jgi:hypothetical protein